VNAQNDKFGRLLVSAGYSIVVVF